ncbi:hypothetical protein BGX33_001445 [Mortierella sp. NVP41]|nr:hypothetical protein BGX33_001445 [Mortierella sp. NVP41]
MVQRQFGIEQISLDGVISDGEQEVVRVMERCGQTLQHLVVGEFQNRNVRDMINVVSASCFYLRNLRVKVFSDVNFQLWVTFLKICYLWSLSNSSVGCRLILSSRLSSDATRSVLDMFISNNSTAKKIKDDTDDEFLLSRVKWTCASTLRQLWICFRPEPEDL